MKNIILAAAFCLLAGPAFATCPANLQLKDNASVTAPALYTDDGAGNCQANVAVKDGADATQGTTTDNPASAGGTGTISAKLREISAQLATLGTNTAAAVPYLNATAWNTNSPYTTGGTNPAIADLQGATWIDAGAWAGTQLGAPSNFGTSPGGVKVIGVNATIIPDTLALGATWVKGTTAAMTGVTSTQVIAAVASNRIYVTRIKCNNSSGSVSTLVQIQDGSAGTVLDTLAAADNFGGEQGTGSTPLFWTTSGNGLFAQDVTTGASVICTASGYSG